MNLQSPHVENSRSVRSGYVFVACGIIGHAALLLVADITRAMSAQLWMLLGWAWLFWVPALIFAVRRSSIRLWLPLLIGFALFAFVAPTLLTFTAWSISGFAP